ELRSTVLKNLKQVFDFNRSQIADTYQEFDMSIVLHINKLVLNQWREPWEANLRSFNDKIDDRWDNLVKYHNSNIAVGDIRLHVQELIEWYKYAIPSVPAIVRIAVTIFRLLQIAPFTSANKFTIIAITDYLLLKSGLSTKSYTSTAR